MLNVSSFGVNHAKLRTAGDLGNINHNVEGFSLSFEMLGLSETGYFFLVKKEIKEDLKREGGWNCGDLKN